MEAGIFLAGSGESVDRVDEDRGEDKGEWARVPRLLLGDDGEGFDKPRIGDVRALDTDRGEWQRMTWLFLTNEDIGLDLGEVGNGVREPT